MAATAIFRRLGVPRRIVTILEGESLINDATALIAYRVAVIAVAIGGVFSLGDAGLSFVVVGIGGILIGLIVGLVLTEAWRRTADPTLEIMISLLAPFAAYLPAEALGVSGVLAAVVAGLIAGRARRRVLSPDARLMGRGVWDIVIFLDQRLRVHAHRPAAAVDPRRPGDCRRRRCSATAWSISLTVIVARIVWVFPATYLPRLLSAEIRERDPYRRREPCSSCRGPACAAPSRWPPRWPCRSRLPRARPASSS